jgi:hypothetical protein
LSANYSLEVPGSLTGNSNGVQGIAETSNWDKRKIEGVGPKGLAENSKMLGANKSKSGIPGTRIIEGCGQQGSGGPPVGKIQEEGCGHPSRENGWGSSRVIVRENGDGTNRRDPEDFTEISNGVQGIAEISNGSKRIGIDGVGSKNLAENSKMLRANEPKYGGPGTRIIEGSCGPPVGKCGGMEQCRSRNKSRDRTSVNVAGLKELKTAHALQKKAAGGMREAAKEMEEKVKDLVHKYGTLNRTGKTGAEQGGKKNNNKSNEL